ncbi:MAG: tautomerase family protein [Spirochaetaceae bacterium]|jgi:phenylpyruvate tautomerase PptA (4-oxalocrotonate tautomerase family)|nr:tautomerase family protein [Spirochaetaceae bacterium]
MPTYQVYVKTNTLNEAQKQKAAQAITKAHSEKTGAPPFYVQVIFNEISDSNRFVGGFRFNRHLWIRGDVRTGRNAAERKELMLAMIQEIAASIGWDKNAIWIDLCGIEPENVLKYGQIFPPPGEEQAWLEGLPRDAREIVNTLIEGRG